MRPDTEELPLRIWRGTGLCVAYGALAAFLVLITWQVIKWFRDGTWTHIGVTDAMRAGLVRCCVRDGDSGRLAQFVQWVDVPSTWFGLHKVLEVVPASLLLFALSMLGNSLFIYCSDQLAARRGAGPHAA